MFRAFLEKQMTKADVVHPPDSTGTSSHFKTVTTCMGTDWKQLFRSAYTYMGMLCKVLISIALYTKVKGQLTPKSGQAMA